MESCFWDASETCPIANIIWSGCDQLVAQWWLWVFQVCSPQVMEGIVMALWVNTDTRTRTFMLLVTRSRTLSGLKYCWVWWQWIWKWRRAWWWGLCLCELRGHFWFDSKIPLHAVRTAMLHWPRDSDLCLARASQWVVTASHSLCVTQFSILYIWT